MPEKEPKTLGDEQRDSAAPAEASATAAQAEASAEECLTQLREELAAARAEVEQYKDRYLRERAELENFKKRMARERAEALRFANEGLVRELIPVLDNLERAIGHAESGGNGQPLVEGVRLVLKTALDVLERFGVVRVEAAGQKFDPSHHEALAQVEDPNREPNEVVQQFLPGYRLHERLIRPAQVSVSTKPSVEKERNGD